MKAGVVNPVYNKLGWAGLGHSLQHTKIAVLKRRRLRVEVIQLPAPAKNAVQALGRLQLPPPRAS